MELSGRKKKKYSGKSLAVTAVLCIFCVIYLFPLFLLVLSSFKEEQYIFDAFYMPSFSYLDNYIKVFTSSTFWGSLVNTLVICIITLSISVVLASMAGYVLARSRERIFKAAKLVYMMALVVPAQANMMILYKLGISMHLINQPLYLILIYLGTNVSYSVMIYSAFTKSIHMEIEEAARIDGCGRVKMFTNVIFPLLKPATGTVIATTIFWYWNDFQGPLIYLSDGKHNTLMLEIFNFKEIIGTTSFASTAWGPVSALCIIASLPIIIFFLLTQEYLLSGMTAGAVKG